MYFKVIIRTLNLIIYWKFCLLQYGWLPDVKFTVLRQNILIYMTGFYLEELPKGSLGNLNLSPELAANLFQLWSHGRIFTSYINNNLLSTGSSTSLTYATGWYSYLWHVFFAWYPWYHIFPLDFLISVFLSTCFSFII